MLILKKGYLVIFFIDQVKKQNFQRFQTDPVPGACNEEFPLENSPFLRLYDNEYVNRLDYQFANIGEL